LKHIDLQQTSYEIWEKKYQLKDEHQQPVDLSIEDTYNRVATALAEPEQDKEFWKERFAWALRNGATPAGRIMSNAGAGQYKPATSLINCTVSQIVGDGMQDILDSVMQAGMTLKAGCGIGYEFSTLRPKGAFVSGAGAHTSGPLTFMDIFDSMCFTISSAGGRRGAQMGTFAVWHPDVEDFIKAKREDGRLRQFNLSLLIDDEFMAAVKAEGKYNLVFPVKQSEVDRGLVKAETVYKKRFWEKDYCIKQDYILNDEDRILCKVYKQIEAKELWDTMMRSTYDYSEPGFLLIDRINEYNNNWFCEEIRATNPCGEQPLPPEGSCLLGSINVAMFVIDPFTGKARFDWDKYKEVVRIFTRMLDNVVEINGLPLEGQRKSIEYKRRHGMGILGVGSALSLLGDTYGSESSIAFTEELMKVMAVVGNEVGIDLAVEKGPAPIFHDTTNGVSNKVLWCASKYMAKIWEVNPELKEKAMQHGCRFTHHTSIAPTGTISLSLNNNASNGIEPSFSHKYTRNVIVEGKKSKQAVDVYSYEMLLHKEITGEDVVPSTFSTADNVTTYAHVDIQAAAQKWCDSSISKTINVPSDIAFDDFKDIYIYAYDNGLKGCTTFRFNPEAFQGVLVNEEDLEATTYIFKLDDGSEVVTKGNDTINYAGEEHTAANLYDAIKENYFGKF
jgi:ribonucleoside-diphosphate reductase alpha chain